jgi:dienelactone hydrolase
MSKEESNQAWERWLSQADLPPNFRVADTRAALARQRDETRATLWKLLGRLPARPQAPAVRVLTTEEHEDYRVERFDIDNAAGDRIPGVLILPIRASRPLPAILWHHSHGGEYEHGCAEVFQTHPTPEAPAATLARRGYAVLSIDACCFGDRSGQGPGGPGEHGSAAEMTAAKLNLWLGRTLWGMMVRDDLIALDYLCSRPEIDAARIAVAGMSMGATRSWWLMALDDRPKAGVAVCCLTRYRDLIATQAIPEHGIYYYVPGMLNHFDTEAVIACVAPRPFLSLAGELDPGSPAEGVRKIERAARPAWQLWNRDNAFRSDIEPGVAHVFTPAMWQKTVAWFDSHLR